MRRSTSLYSEAFRIGLRRRIVFGAFLSLGGCGAVDLAMPGAGGTADLRPGPVAVAVPLGPSEAPQKLLGADWGLAHAALVSALAAPDRADASWINPQSGAMGMIRLRPAAEGCRGFDMTVFRNDVPQRLTGEACWKDRNWIVEGLRPAAPDG